MSLTDAMTNAAAAARIARQAYINAMQTHGVNHEITQRLKREADAASAEQDRTARAVANAMQGQLDHFSAETDALDRMVRR